MARIRSIHPSLFTDEAWVSCSPLARLLYIGLLTEADDQGLFEWKPVQLKLRLLGADNADVPELLAELADANLIAPLQSAGKKLGAVRKFRRFQRPKKPSAQFILPSEWRTYVSLDEASGEDGGDEAGEKPPPDPVERHPVPNQFPTSGETGEQMEDGGRRKKEEGGLGSNEPLSGVAERIWSATSKKGRERSGRKELLAALKAAEKRGKDPGRIEAAVPAYYASHDATKDDGQYAKGVHALIQSDRWEAFAPPEGLFADPPPPDPDAPSEKRQRAWMAEYLEKPNWWKSWERGPRPGEPGCKVAPEIQMEFGVEPEAVH